VSEEPTEESDGEFGEDSELSEEPTQDSYEEFDDEGKELDAHGKPTEEVKVAPEHEATPIEVPPAEMAVQNKTQDQVLKVVL